ncbi:DUF1254 domain-containing protein [Aurantimonas marianensis]|uniref:DUF1254 domain-containing protein n=1 Tax=Aurantimonas marianensis TaxID=2920428 RepID=A0A9X2HC02_9HYPH|nr:DUF1254 domain-containing protein [Aurantimonas marianensis]MCP3054859.1 DUF1254 domain-containing protein [Aurantimonas marianensis]
MGKLLLAIVIGLVGAVIVHIAVIFAMPLVAGNNAWARFSNLGPMYQIVGVEPLRSAGTDAIAPALGSDRQDFAFVDPAFVTASCRFSVAKGPVRILANYDDSPFWSASIYDRRGDTLYSINDRSAVDGVFNLLVGSREQIVEFNANLGPDPEETAIPVELDISEGYMTIRVLVDEESKRPSARAFVNSLQCEPVEPAVASRPDNRDS